MLNASSSAVNMHTQNQIGMLTYIIRKCSCKTRPETQDLKLLVNYNPICSFKHTAANVHCDNDCQVKQTLFHDVQVVLAFSGAHKYSLSSTTLSSNVLLTT